MEYTKQAWTAPTGTGLSRYAKSAESASHVTLTLDPENLTNSPTPFTMARMAHMEEGIAKAYDTAPPTPWAQYSGKDIPQLPDNLAGTTYKRDNDWVSTDGWAGGHASITLSVEDETLKVAYDGTRPNTGLSIQKNIDATGMFIKGHIKCTVPIINVRYNTGSGGVSFTLANPNAYETDFYGYIPTAHTDLILYVNVNQLTAKTCWLSQLYIGTGAYDRLVFDNSYHYRHLLNNAVVPTPQGLYFNGKTSYLRSKEIVTLPDVFTFSATVNCAVSTTSFQRMFENGSLRVYRSANTTALSVQYYNTNTASYTQVFIDKLFIDNTDIDIKIEIDFISKKLKVYRNNALFYSGSAPYIQKPTEEYLYIGSSSDLFYFTLGYMRNICLYDTALTDTQRNWLAQGNTPPILYDVTNYETEGYVSIQDADGTNTGVETDVDSNGNRILKLPATIKASITGNASTADKWKTARNITISDADGTNTGTAVSVDGSENETLKLPATIKANVTGNADTATKLVTAEIETLRRTANFTLRTYADGKKLRIANMHATSTITCTLPTGQTMNGQTSFTIAPDTLLEFELIGTSWKCISNEWEILWENPAKSSSFAQQQITMSAVKEQFKRLVFIYCPYTDGTGYAQIHTKEIPASTTSTSLFFVTCGYGILPQPAAQRNRNVTSITGNTLSFGEGCTTDIDNSAIIPYAIYGIK